jgi:hypothetical protein
VGYARNKFGFQIGAIQCILHVLFQCGVDPFLGKEAAIQGRGSGNDLR